MQADACHKEQKDIPSKLQIAEHLVSLKKSNKKYFGSTTVHDIKSSDEE